MKYKTDTPEGRLRGDVRVTDALNWSPVNGGRNHNGPKVNRNSLSGKFDLHEWCNDLGTGLSCELGEIVVSVKMPITLQRDGKTREPLLQIYIEFG